MWLCHSLTFLYHPTYNQQFADQAVGLHVWYGILSVILRLHTLAVVWNLELTWELQPMYMQQ